MTDEVDDFATNSKRWIKVSVDFFDHPFFENYPTSEREAWLWLVANAAWKTHRIRHGAKMIELQRGQVVIGLKYLANKWGWSVKKVRNFLGLLASDNMIVKSKSQGRLANIATICNYDKFQSRPNPQGHTKGTLGAGKGQVRGNTVEGNKNTIDGCRGAHARSDYEIARDALLAEHEGQIQ